MEQRPKALMLASVASMIGQFNMQNIRLLVEAGFEVEAAANFRYGSTVSGQGVKKIREQLVQMGVKVWHIPVPRQLFRITDIWKAYRQVISLCRKNHYRIVHCHSPIGGVIARAALRQFRKTGTKVIYTVHGFHFYRGAPFQNWLLYYPAEWICSWWTDTLITINREDYRFARNHLHAKQVCYVPGIGIDRKKFCPGQRKQKEQKRKSLGVSDEQILLLSVGELSRRKDHQTVIRAVRSLKNDRIRYFICGIGALEQELDSLIRRLGMEKQVVLLGYRTDIAQLCQAADLFVLPSKQEGLPVALVEAIACKTPVICSDIRGSRELVKDAGCRYQASCADALAECLKRKLGTKTRQEFLEDMQDRVEENYRNLGACDAVCIARKMDYIYKKSSSESILEPVADHV